MTDKEIMKRALSRFRKKDLLYHRRWYSGFPVGETVIFLTVLICALMETGLVL